MLNLDIDAFLRHFRRQREWTHALVRAVPEEYFSWAPAPDAFSCGGLVVHLIQSEVFWRRLVLAAARGEKLDPFQIQGSGQDRLTAFRPGNLSGSQTTKFGSTFAECLVAWREVQAKTEEELATLGDLDLGAIEVTHPLTTLTTSAAEMLLIKIEHEAHHRGQLSAYLKQLGLSQPPVLGLP
ncbi:MAG TPA: DinB family protein [Thermoanaerobaculia bacterium]|nr:DinB family protein [Thermoanaerobaculia bacterium]